jgi:hypothetical protein
MIKRKERRKEKKREEGKKRREEKKRKEYTSIRALTCSGFPLLGPDSAVTLAKRSQGTESE